MIYWGARCNICSTVRNRAQRIPAKLPQPKEARDYESVQMQGRPLPKVYDVTSELGFVLDRTRVKEVSARLSATYNRQRA